MFDESRYRASASRGAHEQSRASAQPPGVPQVFVIGANSNTLGVVNSLKDDPIAAHLIPIAWTPAGLVLGESRQRVGVARSGIGDWADRTFPAEDDRAFLGSLHDLELLLRIGWDSPLPERIDEASVLNLDDLPDELIDALARPSLPLVQCGACRRLCVRDSFAWKERQLCAWDYHAQVFGKRGPWREGAHEARHFESAPRCEYVVPELLEELGVETLLTLGAVPETAAQSILTTLLENVPGVSHMAVSTGSGIVLLQEKPG